MKATAGLVFVGVLHVATAARAELCGDAVIDPVGIGLRDGGFDRGRGACLRRDVWVRLGSHAAIDTPEFYGTLGGDLVLGGRSTYHALEWGLALRLVDYTYVQNAVIKADEMGYGPVEASAAYGGAGELAGRPLQWAAFVVAELPFTRAALDVTTGAAQLGGVATWSAADRVALHGRVAGLGWFGSSTGGTSTRGALATSVDASVRTAPWLWLAAGVDAQLGWHDGGLDHVAARIGAHWRVRGPWRVEVAALAPVLGDERTNAAVGLGLRRDL